MVIGVRHLLRAVLSRNKADAVMGAVDIVGVGAKLVETISYRRAEP
jgi:ABC-type phosphate/phosphonate transport system permease subunit